MKKTTQLGVMAMLFHIFSFKAYGQDYLPAQKPDSCYLQVGAQVPDIVLYSLNNPKKQIQLYDIKSRLTILDFWSIYCTPCIKAFPKLDSLQKEFAGLVSILPVNANGNATLAYKQDSVLNRFERLWNKKFELSTVYIDPVTTSLFFYSVSVPHYIWLNEQKQIIAITDVEAVTRDNIESLLLGKTIQLPVKPADIHKEDVSLRIIPVSLTN